MSDLFIAPVRGRLPTGLVAMKVEASAEGYRFLQRLFDEWEAGTTRFDREGEKLLTAHADGVMAAIGGLTFDPVVTGALRIRRLYVRAAFRKQGIGRTLVEALLDVPRRSGLMVMVNAGRGSSSFWEALGFIQDPSNGHTHVLAQGSPAPNSGNAA